MWTSAQFDAEQQATLAAGAAAVLAVLAGWQLVRLALGPSNPAAAESMKRIHRPASTLPVLGNTLDAMVYQRERFVDWMSEQSQITGGKTWLMTIAGQPPWYVISSPESYEDLLKRQVNIFERGPTMSYIFKDFLGEGIIAVDGHKWLVQRKTAAHLFSNRMMREVMDKVIIEKAIKFRDVLEFCRQRGTPVSLKSLISRFTSDVFTKIGFGVELNGLDPTNVDVETEHPFIEAIAAMCRLLQARAQSPMTWWRLKRWLNIGDEREAKVHMKIIHDLVHEIMLKSFAMKHESLENLAQSKPNGELHAPTAKTGDIISFYIESGLTDPQQLQDMAVNFFFAGKDTTSFSLSWLFVMMNRHPHVLRKIREEIHAKLPELATGEIDAPTMEQLGELTYLEAAVRENLRLNTSMTTRTPNQDTTLSDGTFVPKGSVVYVCHYASARLKSTWGEDAAEYKPERWIDPATGKLIHFSPFKFVTFIAGPRQCPGMRFAILELMTVAAVLLTRFDIKTVEDPFDLTYELSVVFPVKGRLMVTVDKAAPLSPAA